jgi:ammonia channel protein AmtB
LFALVRQVAAMLVGTYAFVVSFVAFRLIGSALDLHVQPDQRRAGLDRSVHGETVALDPDLPPAADTAPVSPTAPI